MQNIDDCVKTIRAARYGREVREPIAKALEIIQEKMQQGNLNEEVQLARGDFETIGQRIDSVEKDYKKIVNAFL